MNIITKKITDLLLIPLLLLVFAPAIAQVNHTPQSPQFKNFSNQLAQINLSFNFPEGFKEIKAVNTESLPFDYAMEIPGADFEIWFRVNTQKDNEKLVADKNLHITNPDSLYVGVAQDQIGGFSSDKNYLKRRLPHYILDRYNADAGSTYLLNLDDSPLTRHYKYALMIVLQKNHAGTVLAICFTNEKGAEFFKNMNEASNCLKFKD
ncbi:MAG TPA: hypothetical protein VL490_00195 [Mucilaginibacter sp.]|nr:hypothetical protein [Mucilaginibacter sp.]